MQLIKGIPFFRNPNCSADSSLPGYYALSSGKSLQTFWRIVLPSSSGPSIPKSVVALEYMLASVRMTGGDGRTSAVCTEFRPEQTQYKPRHHTVPVGRASRWTTEKPWLDSRREQELDLFSKAPGPALAPTQPPMKCIRGLFSLG
jgi:hypothetical protein